LSQKPANIILPQNPDHALRITPLLSYNDVRELLVKQLVNDGLNIEAEIEQTVKRHQQREKDIMRYYKNS